MTTNQLTYMQLQEQARANRAGEAIRGLEAESRAAQLRAETERINAMLPLELRLKEADIERVVNTAEQILIDTYGKRFQMGDAGATGQMNEHLYGNTPGGIGAQIINSVFQAIDYISGIGSGRTGGRSGIGSAISGLGQIAELMG